jgi:hypothetical protein
VLLVYQYRARRPLLMLRSPASTIPVAGVVVAICAAAASTSALGLTVAVLTPHYAPLHPAWAATRSAAWPALSRPTRGGPC